MRYLILGVTEARDEAGVPLPTGGARLRALLAALALRAGRHVPVAELVDDVWGDDPPRDAPAALQALVARLRRVLGGHEAVGFTPAAGYRLAASPDDVDLHRFSRLAAEGGRQLATDPAAAARTLRAALALWRGPALADLPEPARTAHAAAPGARRATALRGRIEADLRGGATAPAALLPEIEALLRESPYDEPLHAQRLRALRAAGRHADALAAYEDTRRTLAEALGTRPGPELTGLHTELLHPPAPQVPPRGTPPHGAPDPGPAREADPHLLPDAAHGTLRPRLTSFVGRETELSGLRDDLARLRLVTLTGPGGSGKTRLAEQAAAAHPEPGRLVELARLDHPSAVPGAVLSALGLRETPSSHGTPRPRTPTPSPCSSSTARTAPCCSSSTTASTSSAPPPSWPSGSSRTAPAYGSWPRAANRWPSRARPSGPWNRCRPPPPTSSSATAGRPPVPVSRPTRTRRPSRRSAGGWTGCRWRSSWRRRGCGC